MICPTDESALLMSDVAHIPQTVASHQHTPTEQQKGAADMLREDPRDSFYQGERRLTVGLFLYHTVDKLSHLPFPTLQLQVLCSLYPPTQFEVILSQMCCVCFAVPLLDNKFLQGVLPDCSYKPSYIIKDFPLLRYQGLQFVCIYKVC